MAGPWTVPAPGRRLGQRHNGVAPTAHRPLDKATPCPHAHPRDGGSRFASGTKPARARAPPQENLTQRRTPQVHRRHRPTAQAHPAELQPERVADVQSESVADNSRNRWPKLPEYAVGAVALLRRPLGFTLSGHSGAAGLAPAGATRLRAAIWDYTVEEGVGVPTTNVLGAT